MEPNIFLGIMNISCGILFVAISIPLVKRKIGMNMFYGFRISKAFESEENWFDINEYGAKQLAVWSVPVILIGIFCICLPFTGHSFWPAILGAGPVTVAAIIAIVKTLMYARKL